MKTYAVGIQREIVGTEFVRADSADEARDLAIIKASRKYGDAVYSIVSMREHTVKGAEENGG